MTEKPKRDPAPPFRVIDADGNEVPFEPRRVTPNRFTWDDHQAGLARLGAQKRNP